MQFWHSERIRFSRRKLLTYGMQTENKSYCWDSNICSERRCQLPNSKYNDCKGLESLLTTYYRYVELQSSKIGCWFVLMLFHVVLAIFRLLRKIYQSLMINLRTSLCMRTCDLWPTLHKSASRVASRCQITFSKQQQAYQSQSNIKTS